MHPDLLVSQISLRQGGVIRRDQARASGLSGGQIDRRIRDGRWLRVGKFGYRTIEMDEPKARARAAVASLPGAVVSHQAAAELLEIPRVPRGIASVLVHSQTTHLFPGVLVHRCHDLASEDVTNIDGVPATTEPRTIVDLGAVLSRRHLASVIDEVLPRGRTSIADITAVLERVARRGKPGIRNLRSVLEARGGGPEAGTVLERKGARLLADAGLRIPHFEFPTPWDEQKRFDAAYPAARLAIEWDSRLWHMRAEAFANDRERDRLAILHGWRVLRFTWEDVTDRPTVVADTVRLALGLRP